MFYKREGGAGADAMATMACSVSRSVEEAAKDPEWPGPPLREYLQTTIKLVKKPPQQRKRAIEKPIRVARRGERRRSHRTPT